MTSEFEKAVHLDLSEQYLRNLDVAYGLPPSTDAEYAAEAQQLVADITREHERRNRER